MESLESPSIATALQSYKTFQESAIGLVIKRMGSSIPATWPQTAQRLGMHACWPLYFGLSGRFPSYCLIRPQCLAFNAPSVLMTYQTFA